MLQVHKETVSRVPNANAGRDNPEHIIHGMAGVPYELLAEKQSKLEAERGAAKQQKTAHTVFGMSVMSGFLSQMNAAGMPGFAPGAAGGMPNPMLFNQLMAQFSQAAAGGAPTAGAPFLVGAANLGGIPPAAAVPAAGIPGIGQPGVETQPGAPVQPTPATGPFTAGWALKPATGVATTAAPPRLDVSATLGLGRSAKLVFDVADDQISPEELLAEHYGWKHDTSSIAVAS